MHKRNIRQIMIGLIVVALLVLATATYAQPDSTSADSLYMPVVFNQPLPSSEPVANAKYVFLFVGDGMAVAQRNATELYLAATTNPGARPEDTTLLMNTFPAQGMNTTYDLTSVIPDSASTGTALATGNKTASGVISMDASGSISYTTIAEHAKQQGWKVGIVSSVSIDHATPATFYAHEPSRGNYREIDETLISSAFDYFAGGPMKRATVDGMPDLWDAAIDEGWNLVRDRVAFDALAAGDEKVLVQMGYTIGGNAMYYAMDDVEENDILLSELVSKGIELLDNDDGFFMMVEAGKIDWACHANDAAAAIHDTIELDNAITQAYNFYMAHPDETLIVVTGDHETGGMTIGFAGTRYRSNIGLVAAQEVSYDLFNAQVVAWRDAGNVVFEDTFATIEEMFGLIIPSEEELADMTARAEQGDADAAATLDLTLSPLELDILRAGFELSMLNKNERPSDEQTYLLYGGYEPMVMKLTTILNQKAGIAWTTYSHTGVPVQTSAIGVRAEMFNGYYDQTDINTKMVYIAGFDPSASTQLP